MRTLAIGLVLVMQAWTGVNDGGNLVAPAVGARTVPALGALVLLVATVAAGPFLIGTRVAATITGAVVALPQAHLEAALAGAMAGAAASVMAAYWRRLPTSVSVAVVGGLVGSALAVGASVHWAGVARILAGLLLAIVAGLALGGAAYRGLVRVATRLTHQGGNRLVRLQPLALALQGVAYGANDAEKGLGLLAWAATARAGAAAHVDPAMVLVVTAAWVVGILLGGGRLAASVGTRVFRVKPLHALTVQGAAGVTVAAASLLGLPVSSTQAVDSALLGVGSVDRPRQVHWRVARDMAMALGATGPAAAAMAFVATRLLV